MCPYIRAHTYSHTHTLSHTQTLSLSHTHPPPYTYKHTHTLPPYTHKHTNTLPPTHTYTHIRTSSHFAKESDVCVTISGLTPSVAKSWMILSAYSSFSFEGFVSSKRTIKRPERKNGNK